MGFSLMELFLDITLADYGLLPLCLRFSYTIARMDAKLGSDGRLTLSGWPLNQLDPAGLAWGTKNSLSRGDYAKI